MRGKSLLNNVMCNIIHMQAFPYLLRSNKLCLKVENQYSGASNKPLFLLSLVHSFFCSTAIVGIFTACPALQYCKNYGCVWTRPSVGEILVRPKLDQPDRFPRPYSLVCKEATCMLSCWNQCCHLIWTCSCMCMLRQHATMQ